MKNLLGKFSKQALTLALTLVMLVFVSITVFAFTHSADQWNYGNEANIWNWNQSRQYSNFYCPVQNHRATAVIAGTNGYLNTYTTHATAAKWANAITGWQDNEQQWQSYYSHE